MKRIALAAVLPWTIGLAWAQQADPLQQQLLELKQQYAASPAWLWTTTPVAAAGLPWVTKGLVTGALNSLPLTCK